MSGRTGCNLGTAGNTCPGISVREWMGGSTSLQKLTLNEDGRVFSPAVFGSLW